jgi:hypothetical protein
METAAINLAARRPVASIDICFSLGVYASASALYVQQRYRGKNLLCSRKLCNALCIFESPTHDAMQIRTACFANAAVSAKSAGKSDAILIAMLRTDEERLMPQPARQTISARWLRRCITLVRAVHLALRHTQIH